MSGSKNICSWIKAAVVLSVAGFHRQGTIFGKFASACSGMSSDKKVNGDKDPQTRMGNRFCKSGPHVIKPKDALREYGYEFNKAGEMRDVETKARFNFEYIPGDRAINQKRYEEIGEIITEYVYELLQEKVQLTKQEIPEDAKQGEEKGFFFMSDHASENDKLMILIHGSGVVRAGQWTRKMIINNDLASGTMLPYIKRAQKNGFAVLIPNGNHRGKKRIRGSETPEEHFKYIWKMFIENSAAKTILIVAHSYGGIVTTEALRSCRGFADRVKAVAFTDSVHGFYSQKDKEREWLTRHSRNWVSSDLELDEPLSPDHVRVSAGTPFHEATSHAAIDSVFKFFGERLGDSRLGEPMEEDKNEEDDTEGSDKKDVTQKENSNEDKAVEGTSEPKGNVDEDVPSADADGQASMDTKDDSKIDEAGGKNEASDGTTDNKNKIDKDPTSAESKEEEKKDTPGTDSNKDNTEGSDEKDVTQKENSNEDKAVEGTSGPEGNVDEDMPSADADGQASMDTKDDSKVDEAGGEGEAGDGTTDNKNKIDKNPASAESKEEEKKDTPGTDSNKDGPSNEVTGMNKDEAHSPKEQVKSEL